MTLVEVLLYSRKTSLEHFLVGEQPKYDIWVHWEDDLCSQGLNGCWQEVSEVDLMVVQDSTAGEIVELGRDCGRIEAGAEAAGVLMLDAVTVA